MAVNCGRAIVYCLKSANSSADVRLGFDLVAIFNIRNRVRVRRVGEVDDDDPSPAALLQSQPENNLRRSRQQSAGRASEVDSRQSQIRPSSSRYHATVEGGVSLALPRR